MRMTKYRGEKEHKIKRPSFRSLAFRLAAQIAARDARSNRTEQRLAEARLSEYLQSRRDGNAIERLKKTISTYDGQGRALLEQLKDWSRDVEGLSGKQKFAVPPV